MTDKFETAMAVNKGITVEQLYDACKRMINRGYGGRHILLSDDDEGNGYHTMFYLFSTPTEEFMELTHDSMHTVDDCVILG